jgi:hypothetical protein
MFVLCSCSIELQRLNFRNFFFVFLKTFKLYKKG